MLKEDDYNKVKEEKDNIEGVYDEIGKLSTVLLEDEESPGLNLNSTREMLLKDS